MSLPGHRAEDQNARPPHSFVCPVDKQPLAPAGDRLICTSCNLQYPIIGGVPILIHESESVFRISDYETQHAYQGASGYGGTLDKSSGTKKAYHRFAGFLSEAPIPGGSFDFLSRILSEQPDAKILVVGSGERQYGGDVTYTDVAFSKNIACICDTHHLPFPDQTFDAVIAEAVLEHVCDPQQCVSEYVRVLKPNGFAFATVPFLQPVHMGAHDFTRFTHLGLRRLFRQFDEIASGICGGPVYSGIHLFREQLLCLTDNHRLQAVLRLLGLLVTFPIRYLDPILSRTMQSYNSSCAFYFFGRKRQSPISDRDILGLFRGH